MRKRFDGIKLLDRNDLAFGYYVEKSMKYADEFDFSKDFQNVNEVIEIYNVHQILSHNVLKEEIVKRYEEKINRFKPIVASFFKGITDENFETICDEVAIGYVEEFWLLFEKFKTYEKISQSTFSKYINNPHTTLHFILKHKKIVDYYDEIFTECLRNSNQTADIIIHIFMEKNPGKNRYYLPKSLQPKEYEEILRNYIFSSHPSPSLLRIIEMYQSSAECPISDKLRLEARKKCKEMLSDGSVTVYNYHIGVGAGFRDIDEIVCTENTPNGILYIYDSKWIKNNLDYSTLLNNFIYIFSFVDNEFRSVFPSVQSQMNIFEKIMGAKGVKEYLTGSSFELTQLKTSAIMRAYFEELRINNIFLEDVIKWFFESYLNEEFNVNGFSFSASSKDCSYLEMCRNLASEMDGILKQFRLYAEEGSIDRELLEMSSRPIEFEEIPSLRENKYIYSNSDEIEQEIYLLFSNQCMLSYVERIGDKYNCLFDLLENANINLEDYVHQDEINQINWLIQKGSLVIKDNFIKPNYIRSFILKDLNNHDVICPNYCPSQVREYLKEMCKSGELKYESSLFSIPEKDYLNYMLNKRQYSNGHELRNRYIHSTYSADEEKHKQDYFDLMKIMILIVIKINEEFCQKDKEK